MAESSTNRRGFLGQVGKTLLVGAGAAATLPVLAETSSAGEQQGKRRAHGRQESPNTASSVVYRCCANPVRCGTCTSGNVTYYCTSSSCSGGEYCTSCRRFTTDCYSVTYPACI